MSAAVAVGVMIPALTFTPAEAVVPAGTTDAPELVSATISPGNEIGVQMQVIYCFDQPLSVANPGLFFAHTYDSGRYLAGSSATINVDTRCANVNFQPSIDLNSQGSLAEADQGAVTASNGVPNYYTAMPYTGSALSPRPGQTTGPDLLAATPQATVTQVQFAFDQAFDPASVKSTYFGAVDDSGVPVMGVGAPVNVSLDKKRVTIDFGTAVNTKARFFVNADAVRTNPMSGTLGSFATTPYTSSPDGVVVASPISRPSLISAQYEANGSWLFTYDQAVNPSTFDASRVKAVFDNANIETAVGFNSVNNNTKQMHVTFNPVGWTAAEPSAVVRMISGNGAARVFNSPGAMAATSFVDLTTAPMAPGRTTGPDLVGMQLDPNNNRAYYYYDEKVAAASSVPTDFKLLIANGNGVNQLAPPSISGTLVTVNYPAQFTTARGVTSRWGATSDPLGQPSVNNATSLAPPADCLAGCNPGQSGSGIAGKLKAKVKGGKVIGKLTSATSACAAKRPMSAQVGKKKAKKKFTTSAQGKFKVRVKPAWRGKKITVKAAAVTRPGVACAAVTKKVRVRR